MTYSYDPTKIRGYGKDQMRFELGDTLTDGGDETTALSDEEYIAILEGVSADTWSQAKLSILNAILHKLAFQVDTKIDTLEYSFSDRVSHWETLYETLKEEVEKTTSQRSVPSMAPMSQGHFWDGMHDNKRGMR